MAAFQATSRSGVGGRRPTRAAVAVLAGLVGVVLLASCSRAAAFVYWADSGTNAIGRANLDTSAASEGFIGGLGFAPCGVAVDGGYVYWGGSGSGTIGRADLDGAHVDPSFITGASFPCGVAVDGAHIYWGNTGIGLDGTTIGRANLDGSSVDQRFIDAADGPCGIAVDDAHIYWSNFGSNTIARAELDGTDINPGFITGANHPCGIAISDGTITGENHPWGAAVGGVTMLRHTVEGGHVYWANSGLNLDGTAIGRAELNGTGVNQSFIGGLHGPWGLAVNDAHVYWGSEGTSTIGRADLEGTGVDESFIAGLERPVGVALDGGSFQLHFGKLEKLKHKGFVKLSVKVPGPGVLKLARTDEVKGQALSAGAAGELILVARPRADAKKRLDERGKVKVTADIEFAPQGATPLTESLALKLVKR